MRTFFLFLFVSVGCGNEPQELLYRSGTVESDTSDVEANSAENSDDAEIDGSNDPDSPVALRKEFYQPQAVVVLPPEEGEAKVLWPTSNPPDLTGTKTSGIQEALKFANDHGWDLFVLGNQDGSAYTYNLERPIEVPAIQGKVVRILQANLAFSGAVTDAAIVFDSTMMMDFSIEGSIIAKHAQVGVRFFPRTPHPLDGTLHNTIGVVDSRFAFAKVEAKSKALEFNSTKAPVTDVLISWEEVNESLISYIGSAFTASNILLRKWQPLELTRQEILAPIGVIVEPTKESMGNVATVLLADGEKTSEVSTAGTTSVGLAEAFKLAETEKLPIYVYGRGLQVAKINGTKYPNTGFYHLNNGFGFNAFKGAKVVIFNATLNYSGQETMLVVNGADKVQFELCGQIVAHNSNGMELASRAGQVFTNSTLNIGHVLASMSKTAVLISTDGVVSEGNTFVFTELLKGNFGLTINDPVNGGQFKGNTIQGVHVHGHAHLGVQIGQSASANSTVVSNKIRLGVNTDGEAVAKGIQVWGSNNEIRGTMLGSPTATHSVAFEPGSSGNTFTTHGLIKPVAQWDASKNSVDTSAKPVKFE